MTKRTIKSALMAMALAVFTTACASAQITDPVVEEFRKALAELGGPNAASPALRQARDRWPEYAAKIDAAENEHEAALAGSKSQQDDCRELYRMRAQTRDTALDHYLYGRFLGLLNELEAAYAEFKVALQRDLYFYWAWDGIGVYNLKRESYDNAVEAFTKALELKPDNQRSVFGLVQAEMKRRNWDRAVMKLRELLAALNPVTDKEAILRARLNLAEIHRLRGDLAQCMSELDIVIREGSAEALVYSLHAYCAKKLELFEIAVQDYTKLIELEPKEARYRFELGTCYRRMGRNADAAVELDRYYENAGPELGEGQRAQLKSEIEKLRKLKPVDDPKNQQLSISDWIDRLVRSTEEKRRREAVMFLAQLPLAVENAETTRRLNIAFLEALNDTDWMVRAKAVEQVGRRLNHQPEIVAKVWKWIIADVDPRVRAMAHHVLPLWENPVIVPYLMKGLSDTDPHVFRQAHDALNTVTLAWIDRILPEDLDPETMQSIRLRWDEWYKINRDAYRKYEPKE